MVKLVWCCMEQKINKLFGPGHYIVLKDIEVSSCSNIEAEVEEDSLTIRYGGIRPKYITSRLIPAKSIVTIYKHTKEYHNSGFVNIIELSCSDDRYYIYTCIIYGNTYNVIAKLDKVGKLLYGSK
jgi:hypothetical protein